MKFFIAFLALALFGAINGSTVVPANDNLTGRKLDRLLQLLRDNRGCDAVVQSCGHKGSCCDVHDECYRIYGCTQSSWFSMWVHWDDCAHCNLEAMRCVAFHRPGESTCCHREDCGQPW